MLCCWKSKLQQRIKYTAALKPNHFARTPPEPVLSPSAAGWASRASHQTDDTVHMWGRSGSTRQLKGPGREGRDKARGKRNEEVWCFMWTCFIWIERCPWIIHFNHWCLSPRSLHAFCIISNKNTKWEKWWTSIILLKRELKNILMKCTQSLLMFSFMTR